MLYKNPIIPGFHPDPSICRVGDDYYLVNSTFEYFPGIPVFHSRDLVNWKQIGHCISRKSQLNLMEGAPNAAGLYAPTIRYSNGVFYVICTNVTHGDGGGGNFFVWTKDINGEWSNPIWLDLPGIDPSLFFDDDGSVYYTGTHNIIYLCKIDLKTGQILREPKEIWEGSGGNNPESPHIYKINGWYYLLIAEGGTELCHMVTIARSKNIEGPYESCPRNPILTNRSKASSIKAVGHADFVQDQNGNWWAVCLGIRPISYPFRHNLGRETMLVPLTWDKDGWPIIGEDGFLADEIETSLLPTNPQYQEIMKDKNIIFKDYFQKPVLDLSWNFIYHPIDESWEIGPGGLTLFGNGVSLSEAKALTWIGRRQEHIECTASSLLCFRRDKNGDEAGLTIYMNNLHHYEMALTRLDGQNCLIFRRQIGSLWKIENVIPYESDEIELELQAVQGLYIFRYKHKGILTEIGRGEAQYLTTEVGGFFTGNYIGLYASGNGSECHNGATFKWFEYNGVNG